jgi:hypothetical protein
MRKKKVKDQAPPILIDLFTSSNDLSCFENDVKEEEDDVKIFDPDRRKGDMDPWVITDFPNP